MFNQATPLAGLKVIYFDSPHFDSKSIHVL